MHAPLALRHLPLGVRLGILGLCLTMMIGLAASAQHLKLHHEKRDERPGLSADDIRGAYHGVRTKSPMVTALTRGHPESLAADKRDALLDWLLGAKDSTGNRPAGGNPNIGSDYDNDLDLGDRAPSEIIRANCLECHGRKAAARSPIAATIPLDYWDDIKPISASRDVKPTDTKILIASTHAHALALGSMGAVIVVLLTLTRWPRGPVSLVSLVLGLGLALDFACWFLAREFAMATWGIILFGGAFNLASVLALVAISADVVLPARGAE